SRAGAVRPWRGWLGTRPTPGPSRHRFLPRSRSPVRDNRAVTVRGRLTARRGPLEPQMEVRFLPPERLAIRGSVAAGVCDPGWVPPPPRHLQHVAVAVAALVLMAAHLYAPTLFQPAAALASTASARAPSPRLAAI